jgi:alpha-aminoadipic semialdehyde synthase
VADIGIRREDKNRWERRVPLTPNHVEELVRELGLSVLVQPSPIRVYTDAEYEAAGAELSEDLSSARVILGVKEVPAELLLPRKPYLFFAHVIKGQPYNMQLLRRFLDLEGTLVDYEPIVDRYDRRLIFFGRHAGFAGMVDALWALGQRFKWEGIDTPLSLVEPAHRYRSVNQAAAFLSDVVGQRIREEGLPRQLHPLVIGFTGGGNVSQGAQEVLRRLPVVEIHPDELPDLAADPQHSRRAVYKVVFRRPHRTRFARHLPHLTALVNGIYWEPGEVRLVTQEDVRRLWAAAETPRLRLLADLSCDIEGSIEVTVRTTTPDEPVFVYEPRSGEATLGVAGRGPVVLAVDNLPAELPRDASEFFGDSLYPFLNALAGADFSRPFEHLTLPAAIMGAVITHQGELTPRYRYLEEALSEAEADSEA